MRKRSILPLLLTALVVLALFAFGGEGLLGQLVQSPTPSVTSSAGPATSGQAASAPAASALSTSAPGSENRSGLPEIRESALPAEGRRVLDLIRAGGPYRYSQDDETFGNFERILPRQARGYYREYTVPTPGESDRGARRIVAGNGGDKYYTDDHYETFRFIAEGS